MEKQFKIKESNLLKIKEFLGEIPHKYASQIEAFLFSKQTLEEIIEEEKSIEGENQPETLEEESSS